MLEKIIELIFPTTCVICGKINKEPLCKKCNVKIEKLLIAKRIEVIGKNFDEFIYFFKYEGIIREKIIQYKFNEKSYLYEAFAKIIINNKKICKFIKNYDIIIPVPISKQRLRERGYNQSELIAKKIAKKIGIEYSKNILIKEKDTKAQSSLNRQEREQNIYNAYKLVDKEKIKGKKILLFDDIYTTGNTVNECSRILKLARVGKIAVLTIAKD